MEYTSSRQTAGRLLKILSAGESSYVSGSEIGAKLQISRNAVWKHIKRLRNEGYSIESCKHRGHRLIARPDMPNDLEVQRLLDTVSLGYPLFYASTVASTNTWASSLADGGAPEGTVAVADTQQNGKGRCGRSWFSPPGANLYFSFILRPAVEPSRITELSIVTGIAIANGLNALFPELDACIKWPNDILCQRRKIGGVLCEMNSEFDAVNHVTIGVGLNVNLKLSGFPGHLHSNSSSVAEITGEQVRRTEVLASLLRRIEGAYKQWQEQGFDPFKNLWPSLCSHQGKTICVKAYNATIRGKSVGITDEGALVIETESKDRHHVRSGDVKVETQV